MQVRLEGLSKYVVNWVMSAGDLVLDRSREVLTNIRTVYIIDEVSIQSDYQTSVLNRSREVLTNIRTVYIIDEVSI